MRNGKLSYINIVITVNDDGYLAQCPGIQGAFAEGDTIEEAIFNCVDVLKMIADYRRERFETIWLNSLQVTSDMQISVALPVNVSDG